MDRHSEATTVLSFRVPTPHAQWVRDRAEKAGMKPNRALRLWLAEAVEKDQEED
jgi:hypothetical protein